jgi:hypothetical protein
MKIMNQEGGIYRGSFHLTWAKSIDFLGVKKSQKVTFSQVKKRGAIFPCAWAH